MSGLSTPALAGRAAAGGRGQRGVRRTRGGGAGAGAGGGREGNRLGRRPGGALNFPGERRGETLGDDQGRNAGRPLRRASSVAAAVAQEPGVLVPKKGRSIQRSSRVRRGVEGRDPAGGVRLDIALTILGEG